PAHASETFNTFTVPLDLTWELDLWGRVRRQVDSTRAQLEAGAADLEAVRLALQAEIAADYFTLRAQEDELALLQSTATAQSKALELTRNRRGGGIATDLDVAQAETQLRTTEAQVPVVELERTKTLHALATLTGHPAGSMVVAAPVSRGGAVTNLDWEAGLPGELLQRRPDIAAAERRMAAANADIGVAKGAFYPSFTFSASAGFQSVSASSLFDWPSRLWAIGPAMSLPLFEGGRNRAGLARAKAVWEETVAQYRQTVLTAVQEVEDQLAARRLLAAQATAETAALTSARRALEIALNRYRGGLVTYLEVATAQQNALDRERTVARLRGEQQVAAVALVKALGGGWDGAPMAVAAKP
ncbi:MAG TPA: efflux transporter outer membrane subunit, partial [Candidatus Limnocylindria bacterium]|nr:efflux transporter outer membrane subunit [Candidatus Limnocylindria bacterium]